MSKVTIAGEGMRGIIKIESPSMSLYNVLKEFCVKNKLNPDNYALKHRNNILDLSTPWRLAGLPNNCEIEIVRAVGGAKKQKSGTANVAVQLLDGSRSMNTLPLSSSLWEVLRASEQKSNVNITRVKNEQSGVYRQPVVAMMNNAVRGVTDLSKTTLTACGLRNGDNSLFRLSLEDSTTPYEEAVKYIQQVEEELAKKAEAPTPAPQSPKPKSPFENTTATSPSEITQQQTAAAASSSAPSPTPVATPAVQQEQAPATTTSESSAFASSPAEDVMEIEEPPVYAPVEDEHAVHVKVFKPSTASFNPKEITEIDEKEFELTMEDAKLAMQDLARKREDREAFRSVQTRETEKKKKQRIYDRALIRIRFPSGYFVQATFKPENTIGHVISFVRKVLTQPDNTFYLYVSPPVRRLDIEREKTLKDLQLLPASLINVALDKKNAKPGESEPAIKEEYLQLAQEVKKEKLPEGKLQEEIEEEKKAAAAASSASSSSFRGEGRTLGASSSSAAGGISRLVQQPAKKSGSQKPKWLKL